MDVRKYFFKQIMEDFMEIEIDPSEHESHFKYSYNPYNGSESYELYSKPLFYKNIEYKYRVEYDIEYKIEIDLSISDFSIKLKKIEVMITDEEINKIYTIDPVHVSCYTDILNILTMNDFEKITNNLKIKIDQMLDNFLKFGMNNEEIQKILVRDIL